MSGVTTAATHGASTSKSAILQLHFKTKAELQASFITLFEEGGIFVPTPHEYNLGDDAYVLLTLPDDPQRYAVTGKVAWINPLGAVGNREMGIGIAFGTDAKFRALCQRIEEILGVQNRNNVTTHIF